MKVWQEKTVMAGKDVEYYQRWGFMLMGGGVYCPYA